MQSDGPLRPLTVQTFLSLPNGQMHIVIFAGNSPNDERVGGGCVGVGGGGGLSEEEEEEGGSWCESSGCLLLFLCDYIYDLCLFLSFFLSF